MFYHICNHVKKYKAKFNVKFFLRYLKNDLTLQMYGTP